MCDFSGEIYLCEVKVWNLKLMVMWIDALD